MTREPLIAQNRVATCDIRASQHVVENAEDDGRGGMWKGQGRARTDKSGHPVDGGVSSRQTQAAVLGFRAARGLVQDGEVGPKTARALGIALV